MSMIKSAKTPRRSTMVIAITGALMASGAAAAQDAEPSARAVTSSASTQASAPDAKTLDTIIVTSNKRVENVRKIPGAVSVVNAEQLENLHATQFTDFAAYIPGLQFTSTGAPGKTEIALRGIAPLSSGTTVGNYLDETQLGSSGLYQQAVNFQLDLLPYDISRVEILRGPQGTLYGAGSMGGLVKYVTRAPDLNSRQFEFGGGLSNVSGGGNGWDGRFGANLPLVTDKAALRVSFARNKLPGYINNAVDGRKDINGGSQDSAHAALLWQPSDDFSLQLSALGQRIDSRNNALVALDPLTQRPKYGNLTNSVWFNEPFRKEIGVLSATMDWNLGWADFISASGYSNTSTRQRSDTTTQFGIFTRFLGSPDAGGSTFDLGLNLHKFTQEFRLTSKPGTPFLWQAGAYYTKETASLGQYAVLTQIDGSPLPPSLAGFGVIARLAIPSTYKEKALFSNASYRFNDRFTLGAGMRYASNDQNFAQVVSEGFALPLGTSPGKSSENVFTWQVSPQFKLSDDSMLYARVATGYQPGGPNVAAPGVPPQVGSSRLASSELGLKSEFADHRVVFDIAAFSIDWKNLQVGRIGPPPTQLNYLTNAGKAKSQGVELSTVFKPTDNLRLGLIGTYTDAKLSNNDTTDPNRGNRLPYIPRFSGALTADYFFPLGGWGGHAGGGYRWVGSRESDIENRTTTHLESYGALDLNADVSNANWTIRAYLKNATNKTAYLNKSEVNGFVTDRIAAVPIQPRTVGVEFDYRF